MKRVLVLILALCVLQPLLIALIAAAVCVSPLIFCFMVISHFSALKKAKKQSLKAPVNYQELAKTEFEKACAGLSTAKEFQSFDGMAKVVN